MSNIENFEGAFVGHIEDGIVAITTAVVDGRRYAEAEIVTGLSSINVPPAQLSDLVAVLARLPDCAADEQITGDYWIGTLRRDMFGVWTGDTVRTGFGFATTKQLATFADVVQKAQQLVAELLTDEA